MPETRLVYKLKNTEAISTIVGTKVFAIGAPLDESGQVAVALPYITYQTISDQSVNHAAGATDTNHCRIQVDLWASTYSGVKALATAVKTALKSWTDDSGDPIVSSCHYESGQDMPEPPSPGQERRIHRVSHDYILWYVPAAE